jgi:hypothetical protein
MSMENFTKPACCTERKTVILWDGLVIHKFLPLFILYFFFNTMGLPKGLYYTSVLLPLFYLYLLKNNVRHVTTYFCIWMSPFVVMHFVNGVSWKDYVVSLTMFFSVYVASYAIREGLHQTRNIGTFLVAIIKVNFLLSLVGLLLKFTPYAFVMWREGDVISADIDEMMRFQMFMYEPSQYSHLIAPLVLYAYFRFLHDSCLSRLGLLLMVIVPLLMSYSFGNISAIMIAITLINAIYLRQIFRLNRKYVLAIPFVLLAVLAVSLKGPFLIRLQNFLSGHDSSGQARTVLSYIFSYQIAKTKSLLWGVGFGQVKLLGVDIIAEINPSWAEAGARLPCAIADTMATCGFIGIFIRLFLEFVFFMKKKVYKNYLRFALFIYMFVYQFTGSYLSNIMEYVIWTVAFSSLFPEFSIPEISAVATKPIPCNHATSTTGGEAT